MKYENDSVHSLSEHGYSTDLHAFTGSKFCLFLFCFIFSFKQGKEKGERKRRALEETQ